jgi:Trp repressor protein
MTNVSRNPLPANKQDQLFSELSKVMSHLSSKDTKFFLSELLGNEEQIMLAKRFAAIVLLERQYSLYKISSVLHLSSATVAKLNNQRISGHYKNITRWLKQDTSQAKEFFELLDSVLTLGGLLPHYGKQSQFIRKFSK